MRRIIGYLFILLVIFLGISFALLNANSVTLNYYVGDVTWPLSLLLAFVLGVGMAMGFLGAMGLYFKQKRKISQLHRDIKLAQKEINNLREIPLKDTH